ncbi:Uncharacterized protein dnl_42170 [Desulfonema limicola]|uniref:Uncharacterized protein n=1 Tax=Desulfonema limicola TaxID=45656 RepID=A0A975BAJ5_9BACT|nr:hypothetical protein [Desulfonema limicola]QTA81863.1 Uncharacterized protein dnl_42170 [Desulfonema limicola]
MKDNAISILEKIEKEGESSLEEIASIIPKKYKDHRDFYIFANLVSLEYIERDLLKSDKQDPNSKNTQLLARELFACCTAEQSAEYKNAVYSRSGDVMLKEQKFSLSGKGSLFLSERRTKRLDRILTISSGIVVGIIVALVNNYLRSIFH